MTCYEAVARIAKSGCIEAFTKKDFSYYVEKIANKCYPLNKEDNYIDNIYKAYICASKEQDTRSFLKQCGIKIPRGLDNLTITENDVVHCLKFHCSTDFELTIIGKTLFNLNSTQKVFIDKQIQCLVDYRNINILEFYNCINQQNIYNITPKNCILSRKGYEPWERNGFYEYGDNGKLIMPN